MRTNQLPGGLTLLQVDPDCAVDLDSTSPSHGWLFTRIDATHPWVTLRKLGQVELDQAWDQSVDGAVLQGTKVRCA